MGGPMARWTRARLRRGATGFCISAAATAILLLLVEAGMRLLAANAEAPAAADALPEIGFGEHALLHRPSSIPGAIYELRPGAGREILGIQNRVNSLGLRDRETSQEKTAGVFRVAVLGDSLTYGWRVPLEECYVKQLESRLNELFAGKRRFEVLNFGVSGYNAEQETALLRAKVLGFHPDLVILGLVTNDIEPAVSPLALFFARRDPVLEQRLQAQAERVCALYAPRAVEEVLPSWLAWSRLARAVAQRLQEGAGRDYVESFFSDQELWNVFVRSLAGARDLLRDEGVPLFAAVFPQDVHLVHKASRRAVDAKIRGMLAELRIPHASLLDPFAAVSPETIVLDDTDPHPNARGHALAADTILAALLDQGLIPR